VKKYDIAIKILMVLEQEGFEARLVGGCVRDNLLKVEPKDYDIATTATPKETTAALTKNKIKAIPTGIEHGTVTAATNGASVEITTLREDVATDGRHAKVKFGKSFKQDALRRDFTINALSQDLRGEVFDYFSGVKDLKNNKVVFVGESTTRIQEDYLRILRYFRFLSRLGAKEDNKILKSIKENKEGLAKVSRERILNEIQEICSVKNYLDYLLLMKDVGLWEIIFPLFIKEEIDKVDKPSLLKLGSLIDSVEIFLAVVYIMVRKQLKEKEIVSSCNELKFSKLQRQTVVKLLLGYYRLSENFDNDADCLLFAEFCGDLSFIKKCFNIWDKLLDDNSFAKNNLKKIKTSYEKYSQRIENKLPISGQDIKDIYPGISGYTLGVKLKDLRYLFLDGKWSTRKEGLEIVKKL
jgi:tRNA nucleotidyltransferase/poly(A) polymerase